MDNEQFWVLILSLLSIALLFVNFFRFNILIVIAAIFANIGLAYQPGAPRWLIYTALMLALAEATTGFVKLVFGRKNKGRYTG